MQVLKVDFSQEIPLIDAVVMGQRGSRRCKLVFDTGCGMTQIDTALLENLGYCAREAIERISVRGPAGEAQEGFAIRVKKLSLFGMTFSELAIAAYDFDNFSQYGIDGLLGFDVIKRLHLEMDGPAGILKIF